MATSKSTERIIAPLSKTVEHFSRLSVITLKLVKKKTKKTLDGEITRTIMSGIALQFLSDVRLRRLMPADGNAKRFCKNVEWIQLFEYELHDKVQRS